MELSVTSRSAACNQSNICVVKRLERQLAGTNPSARLLKTRRKSRLRGDLKLSRRPSSDRSCASQRSGQAVVLRRGRRLVRRVRSKLVAPKARYKKTACGAAEPCGSCVHLAAAADIVPSVTAHPGAIQCECGSR